MEVNFDKTFPVSLAEIKYANKERVSLSNKFWKTNKREDLKGSWIKNGKQYLCNSYIAIRYEEPIYDCRIIPDDVNKIDIEYMIENDISEDIDLFFIRKDELVNQLKRAIKECRVLKIKNSKVYIDNKEGKKVTFVNAKYLLDAVKTLTNTKYGFLFVERNKFYPTDSAIHIIGGNGDALVMPIREFKETCPYFDKLNQIRFD